MDTRLVVPALRTLDGLLAGGMLDLCGRATSTSDDGATSTLIRASPSIETGPAPKLQLGSSFVEDCVAVVSRRVSTGLDDAARLISAASVLTNFVGISSSSIRGGTPITCTSGRTAISVLLGLLGHKYPHVRKAVAERMYVRLLTTEIIFNDVHDDAAEALAPSSTSASSESRQAEALVLLSSTLWDAEDVTAAVTPHLHRLHVLLGVRVPSSTMGTVTTADGTALEGSVGGGGGNDAIYPSSARSRAAAAAAEADVPDDYGALVREMGY